MSVVVLDHIPLPLSGDAATVGAKARDLSNTASALRTAIRELQQLASDNVTISEAVDEIRVKADGVRDQVVKVESRYQGAATAMFAYQSGLSNAQTRANAARQRVIDNNADASYWRRRLNMLIMQAESGESSKELLADILEAKSRVATFAVEFQRAMAQYNGAEGDRVAAVDAAIQALHDAADASGLNDSVFDYLGLGSEILYEWAQQHFAPVLEAIRLALEAIKSIIDILALIVTILSVFLPFLAPLAAAMTLASVLLAGLILLSSLLLFALGKETLGRVLGDAIGLAIGVITAKMGGLNVFKPGSSLAGISSVFSRSAWVNGASSFTVRFAANAAGVGVTETASKIGVDIATELFSPEAMIDAGESFVTGLLEGGLDVQLDFFPEGGNGGMWGPFEGGWNLATEEFGEALITPVADFMTGGIATSIVTLVENVTPSVAAA